MRCWNLRNPKTQGFTVGFDRTTAPGCPLTDEDRSRPGEVRRIERAHLRLWGADRLVGTADILVTELVTNAFEHGRGPVEVRLWCTASRFWLRVGSGSRIEIDEGWLEALDEDLAQTGRGLLLVDAFADSWGLSDDRTWVWCSLLTPEGESLKEAMPAD
ncbi:ATP-binding protein [Streptomyces katsurahamanus]|uniref:ATP-binding protein n=1 Tax=Streptomyces katsurahamanus TaxID=2577098 RepID=A0ABW9NXR5_9ACTN|nr:ATP-binding protein [Streptomyces katsurahamanus]